MLKYIALFFAFSAVLFTACNKELSPSEQWDADIAIIDQYIADNNLDMERTDTGLHYVITDNSGSIDYPTVDSMVEVRYKGYFLDGEVFDETPGTETRTFPLGNLILAWQEAIVLMPKGSKMTIVAPSALCYGPNGSGPIPGNEVLGFDIELVNF